MCGTAEVGRFEKIWLFLCAATSVFGLSIGYSGVSQTFFQNAQWANDHIHKITLEQTYQWSVFAFLLITQPVQDIRMTSSSFPGGHWDTPRDAVFKPCVTMFTCSAVEISGGTALTGWPVPKPLSLHGSNCPRPQTFASEKMLFLPYSLSSVTMQFEDHIGASSGPLDVTPWAVCAEVYTMHALHVDNSVVWGFEVTQDA